MKKILKILSIFLVIIVTIIIGIFSYIFYDVKYSEDYFDLVNKLNVTLDKEKLSKKEREKISKLLQNLKEKKIETIRGPDYLISFNGNLERRSIAIFEKEKFLQRGACFLDEGVNKKLEGYEMTEELIEIFKEILK